ncbi:MULTISPECIES: hypothetical protein [Burkholderia]|uniref:Uncharacterized protein n=1 Tax=Burkholderia pyrrocinia TaxID=60550 RepID=A0A318J025_BURPY|nr:MULTISPECIES: hypothetical protein [Burkholderia]PXX41109.1 hypothetical protein NA66_1001719 [Burkholderia pyrrocinia]SFW58347.1 hypothetical protein SAMN03159384_03035 [Burkholderia sp. NFACC33-1]SFY11706.1 hypothetical protein SAMN03159408_03247 [Burkholderia sp. NFPP32]
MSIKAGDLAIIVRSRTSLGRKFIGSIVEVVCVAPLAEFQLPDGHQHVAGDPGDWVVKAIGMRFVVPMSNGSIRQSLYAVGHESCLRPISGLPITDDIKDEVTA